MQGGLPTLARYIVPIFMMAAPFQGRKDRIRLFDNVFCYFTSKMYKDYMNQYEETFRQHQAKYSETAAAQEYFQEKKEFDEIQNKVLKLSQLLTQKEAEVMDLQGKSIISVLSIEFALNKIYRIL